MIFFFESIFSEKVHCIKEVHYRTTLYNSDALGGSYVAVAPMDGGSAFAL